MPLRPFTRESLRCVSAEQGEDLALEPEERAVGLVQRAEDVPKLSLHHGFTDLRQLNERERGLVRYVDEER
jgi:hypothetical protein